MLSRSERLKRARIALSHGGAVGENLIGAQIAASWNRCVKAGLDPRGTPPTLQFTAQELRDRRDRNELVRRFALDEMHSLYQQIAGSNFMIAFGDAEGTVLETISDRQFQASKAGRAIVPGSIWAENQRGTNALGTCAAIRQPIVVHGEEHFFLDHADVSCFSAPVLHSNGALAGVLDASSDCSVRQTHTLALMRMAATHIENSLFLAQQDEHFVLLFHSRAELLNSISGGLVSFDHCGRLVAINHRGREILSGLSVRPGVPFEAIFDVSFEIAMDELAGSRGPALRDLLGSQYSVLWRNRHNFERRVRQSRPSPSLSYAPKHTKDSASFVVADRQIQAEINKVVRSAHLAPPFLILGESGTGKELMARYIHARSGRSGQFVALNCGAVPEELFEVELFGHVAGAFTGARKDGARGLAAAAHKGTLFLDEIGDLPMANQAAVLRFLDSHEIRPVGGEGVSRVDVQIVAATNVDLKQAIAEKKFRADLYYRLNVVQLRLPTLNERQDFAEIARHMLSTINPRQSLSQQAIDTLAARSWKGNMRELRSVLFQLSLHTGERHVTAEDVRDLLEGTVDNGRPVVLETAPDLRSKIAREIRDLLRSNGNNVTQAAKILRISRTTVYKYRKAFDAGL